jgi:hypothetical protein
MIPFRDLLRIRRHLQLAQDKFMTLYPTEIQDWQASAGDLETVRNLDTALAEIDVWIAYRANNRRDPYLRERSGPSGNQNTGGVVGNGSSAPDASQALIPNPLPPERECS